MRGPEVVISKVAVSTNGATNPDIVIPGRPSKQSVAVWHYPQRYSRRVSVRTSPLEGDPLVYKRSDGREVSAAADQRDSPLIIGRSSKIFWTFEFNDYSLEHQQSQCDAPQPNHTITARALSARTIEYPNRRGQAVPQQWDAKTHTVSCENGSS